jgi:hypothetical protein
MRIEVTDVVKPPLAWPATLRRPAESRPIVYLDLNHWISLAKATVGHAHGDAFKECLEKCQSAVNSGRAMFVLAGAHYSEILKVGFPRQRRDLADVMESLTRFRALVSRVTIMKLELAAALDFALGLTPRDPEVALIGYGVCHAFGQSNGGFRIRDRATGEDVTPHFRQKYGPEKFDAYMANALLEFERSNLRGPQDETELQKLQNLGYAPQQALQVARNRANEERTQTLRLDGEGPWRRERLPDVVSARELLIEFQNMAPTAFQERGVGLEDVLTSPAAGVAFMRSMPSTDVSIALKTAWHRNRDKPWSANDIYDIDAMALAVPYCDVVVTEKACHHALVSTGMDTRMKTVLLRDLQSLVSTLRDWKPA